jgi:hypothetical protein
VRIDLVGTTADFSPFWPAVPLPHNHLLGENHRTAGRIGEVRLVPVQKHLSFQCGTGAEAGLSRNESRRFAVA